MLIFLDNVRVLNDSFTFIPSTEDTGAATVTGAFGFGIAFLGGLLSFLSPCCRWCPSTWATWRASVRRRRRGRRSATPPRPPLGAG